MGHRRFGPRLATIRASDLAKLGYCEQRVVLEKQLGERLTGEQRAGIRRGTEAHDRFLRQSLVINPSVGTSKPKRWCFIATAVFGADAPQTERLREFRDTVLRPTLLGRFAIRAYYRASPAIVDGLQRRPWALRAMRKMLCAFIACLDGSSPTDTSPKEHKP
ncbi:MAG TPA: hypothetical protein PKV98_01600 [Burkholderiaceae bacterium]|nr:hypothetical protein [Burkholderiaceae bacterium]